MLPFVFCLAESCQNHWFTGMSPPCALIRFSCVILYCYFSGCYGGYEQAYLIHPVLLIFLAPSLAYETELVCVLLTPSLVVSLKGSF